MHLNFLLFTEQQYRESLDHQDAAAEVSFFWHYVHYGA